MMALAGLEVVEVVRRCHLDRARAEGGIHEHGVADDGDSVPQEWMPHAAANEMLVARIIRMDRHGRIAEHGLGPRGGDHDLAGAVLERIGERPELALVRIVVLDLEIR
jgi:hypothetical protein